MLPSRISAVLFLHCCSYTVYKDSGILPDLKTSTYSSNLNKIAHETCMLQFTWHTLFSSICIVTKSVTFEVHMHMFNRCHFCITILHDAITKVNMHHLGWETAGGPHRWIQGNSENGQQNSHPCYIINFICNVIAWCRCTRFRLWTDLHPQIQLGPGPEPGLEKITALTYQWFSI